MRLINIIKNLLHTYKKVDLSSLPSQGLFYRDNFMISIKKASIEDIIEYEYKYIKSDINIVIEKLKKIVKKNSKISKGYSFNDIKSIDIVFLFLEIVKMTKKKEIVVHYSNIYGETESINFDSNSFNYFNITNDLRKKYDSVNKLFDIDGYKYTLPSIGIENSITKYLISKQFDSDAAKYNEYNYHFTYFLGEKNNLNFKEIDNLITIFNFEMTDKEKLKINKIIKTFMPIQRYTLKKGNNIIEISSKIDLEKIWK